MVADRAGPVAPLDADAGDAGIAIWREKLYPFMTRNAVAAWDYFQIPPQRAIELGTQVRQTREPGPAQFDEKERHPDRAVPQWWPG